MKYTKEQAEMLRNKFKLSQSAIKQLLDRESNEVRYCMKQFGNTYILKSDKLEKEVFNRGNLFEYLAIGQNSSHSDNHANMVLSRKKPNKQQKMLGEKGDMTILEQRIREQGAKCKQTMEDKGWNISEDNTQVVFFKVINPEAPIEQWKIFRGEADIAFIPTNTTSFGRTISIIDLKNTASVSNLFGPYSWANHEYMNKLQSYSYLWAAKDIDFELNDILNPGNNLRKAVISCGYNMIKQDNPNIDIDYDNLSKKEEELLSKMVLDLIDKGHVSFIYYVWENAPAMGNLMVPVEISKDSSYILKESFRKSINIIEEMIGYYNEHGEFREDAHPEVCKDCHIKECKMRDSGEFLY